MWVVEISDSSSDVSVIIVARFLLSEACSFHPSFSMIQPAARIGFLSRLMLTLSSEGETARIRAPFRKPFAAASSARCSSPRSRDYPRLRIAACPSRTPMSPAPPVKIPSLMPYAYVDAVPTCVDTSAQRHQAPPSLHSPSKSRIKPIHSPGPSHPPKQGNPPLSVHLHSPHSLALGPVPHLLHSHSAS
jgi:hypothetical protein